jgi:hypothetical protein
MGGPSASRAAPDRSAVTLARVAPPATLLSRERRDIELITVSFAKGR